MQKINPLALVNIISKFQLGGNIESVTFTVSGGTLTAKFITEDKSMFGELVAKEVDVPDGSYSVYSLSKFVSLLRILSGDKVNAKVTKLDDEVKYMEFTDNVGNKVTVTLASSVVIPQAPKEVAYPDMESSFTITTDFITMFSKGLSALGSPPNFAFVMTDNKPFVSLNHNPSSQVDTVNIPLTGTSGIETPVYFKSQIASDILSANKDASTLSLDLSNAGMAVFKFKHEKMACRYVLIASHVEG